MDVNKSSNSSRQLLEPLGLKFSLDCLSTMKASIDWHVNLFKENNRLIYDAFVKNEFKPTEEGQMRSRSQSRSRSQGRARSQSRSRSAINRRTEANTSNASISTQSRPVPLSQETKRKAKNIIDECRKMNSLLMEFISKVEKEIEQPICKKKLY